MRLNRSLSLRVSGTARVVDRRGAVRLGWLFEVSLVLALVAIGGAAWWGWQQVRDLDVQAIEDWPAEEAPVEPSAEDHLASGRHSLLYSRNYGWALDHYTQAIEADPEFALAYYERAIVRHELGQPDSAMEDVNEAIRLDPQLWQAFEFRSRRYLERNELDAALKDAETVVRLVPDLTAGYTTRATLRLHKRDYREVVADAERALQLDPECLVAHCRRGLAFAQMHQPDQALVSLRAAESLAPASFETLMLGARVELVRGNLTIAHAYADRALAAKPNAWEALAERADVRMALGNWQLAQEDLAAVIKQVPSMPMYYQMRARCLHELGQTREARYDEAAAQALLQGSHKQ